MPRDCMDIALKTIALNISTETGISSGSIWLQYSNDDYVNGRTFQTFPSIGIAEVGKSVFRKMNYGCKQIGAAVGDGSFTIYSPLGEKFATVLIELWANTQSQRRQYKAIIEQFLLENQYLATSIANDPVTGEYVNLEFLDYELSDDKPFTCSFYVKVVVPVFKEQASWIADTIQINSAIGQEIIIPANGNWTASGNPWIIITSGGVSTTGEPATDITTY